MTFALTTPTDPDDTPVPFPLMPSAGKVLGAALFPAGLISVGLHLLGQADHAQVNLIAAAICGVGCIVGLVPVWFLSKQHRHGAAQGFMAGMLLRVALCVTAYFALQWSGYPHAKLLVYYMAGWYLLTLMVEVKLVSSFLLEHAVAPAVAESAPEDAEPASAEPSDANAAAPTGRAGLEGDV
ncbi:hypothetical protein [Algisphaera agarilytica]|uniref:Uncharacterized protein n=1 Tax=Algisphaera agarilytica TaxID=1385975 RepID=A0A7X0H980_9BACT|nr:hypothetical protein [Algisphaera agarilytica]MBB6430416.1 hypothetical protein [Algisphaera agarilytica]